MTFLERVALACAGYDGDVSHLIGTNDGATLNAEAILNMPEIRALRHLAQEIIAAQGRDDILGRFAKREIAFLPDSLLDWLG